MSFVVEIPSLFTKSSQIPNRLGNTSLTGNETINGNLSLLGSLTLNNNDNTNNEIIYPSLDISASLNVQGDTSMNHVNVSGIMTLTNQPRFMAYYTPNNNIVISSGVNIPYNGLKYHIGGGYNTTNYTYTIPIAGLYLFTLSFFSNSVPYIVDLKKNNKIIQRCETNKTTTYETRSIMVYNQCNQNDVMNAYIQYGSIRVANSSLLQGWHQFSGLRVA